MKDISPKKSIGSKSASGSERKMSRADEIEEIYRSNGSGFKNIKTGNDTNNNWSHAVAKRPTGRKWLFLTGLTALVIIFLMFLIGAIFGKATLTITPKQGDLILSGVEDAEKREVNSSTTPSLLFFDTITKVDDTEKRLVNASGEEKVEKKAEGKIVVYNKNAVSQKLVTNTRFEAPNGNIYRINSPVIVPAGSTKRPGSVEASVIADKPGPSYNIGLVDFTVPGFAGTAKFKTIYARSKTEMTGGFSGMVRRVSQADLDKNRAELQKILRDRLLKKAQQDIPGGYILFSDATKIKYDDQVVNDPSLPPDKAYVSVHATLSGIIFKRDELSMYFAQKLIPNYDNSPVEIDNLDNLEFALQNKDVLDLEKTTKVSFSLDGTGHVVWLFNEDNLKKDLVGKTRSEAEKIWPKFIAIERAKTTLFPPWRWTFPKKESRMIIEIEKGIK